MPDAPTVAAWASVINPLGLAILFWFVFMQSRHIKFLKEQNGLLRSTLEVCDVPKMNERMRAFKEQEEIASEKRMKELEEKIAAGGTARDTLVQISNDATKQYETLRTYLAMTHLISRADRLLFTQSPYVPDRMKADVMQTVELIEAMAKRYKRKPATQEGGFDRLARGERS